MQEAGAEKAFVMAALERADSVLRSFRQEASGLLAEKEKIQQESMRRKEQRDGLQAELGESKAALNAVKGEMTLMKAALAKRWWGRRWLTRFLRR